MTSTKIQPPTRWTPNVTVATVIERGGAFLLVQEYDPQRKMIVLNQPAGHLEPDENLCDAAVREVLEETRWRVTLTAYLGVSLYQAENGISYLRHSFSASPDQELTERELDLAIDSTIWLTAAEVREQESRWRSPLVMRDIDRYLCGLSAPLALACHQ
jgi:ADP-ribose pyrophosphatase YjhB (NUDIX family)